MEILSTVKLESYTPIYPDGKQSRYTRELWETKGIGWRGTPETRYDIKIFDNRIQKYIPGMTCMANKEAAIKTLMDY